MKKLLPALVAAAMLLSCNNGSEKGKFTVNGELKNADGKKVYLEELFFSQKAPEVLDTGVVKDGKLSVSTLAKEEGLYRIRPENGTNAFLFINDAGSIAFTADAANPAVSNQQFRSPANISLRNLMLYADSVSTIISQKDKMLSGLKESGVAAGDSAYMALDKEVNALNDGLTRHFFAVADTAKSPVLALFAATMAPVPINKFEAPLLALAKRFPDHKGIAGAVSYVTEQVKLQTQTQPAAPSAPVTVGTMAPEITMNDVNGKPFSLSQLRGKYVLVDFWASWCGPCREENPNLVAAYEKFKDKNFTILGVSLDEDKNNWVNAIAQDKLNWQQISDLKKWRSAAVGLYGLDGIPYNVLVDPQGKIIATALRGSDLHSKLGTILK
jgi:peroxiredoxin